jgi:hypothetical protein
MEMPRIHESDIQETMTVEQVPARAARQLPSLIRMTAMKYPEVDASEEDPSQYLVERMDISDSKMRLHLAFAQILKDIDYPREPFPSFVQDILDAAVFQALRSRWKDNTFHLMLSLGANVNNPMGNPTLLHVACNGYWSEEFLDKARKDEPMEWQEHWLWQESCAKQLIRLGCDLAPLENGTCPNVNPREISWNRLFREVPDVATISATIRKELLDFAYAEKSRTVETSEIFQKF